MIAKISTCVNTFTHNAVFIRCGIFNYVNTAKIICMRQHWLYVVINTCDTIINYLLIRNTACNTIKQNEQLLKCIISEVVYLETNTERMDRAFLSSETTVHVYKIYSGKYLLFSLKQSTTCLVCSGGSQGYDEFKTRKI